MNIVFRETKMDNQIDNESIVKLLNEFMNRRDTGSSIKKIDMGIIEEFKEISTTRIYLCESSKEIIGIAVCFIGFSTYRQKKLLNIHDFFIREDFQGKGNGRLFLEYIEQECLKNDLCRVTLEVYGDNTNAIKLYKNGGFVGNESVENNVLIYAMKKDLNGEV